MAAKINAQWDGKTFHPYTDQDRDEVAVFKKNQIVTINVAGTKKAPSVKQMNLYWATCRLFAENSDSQHFNTKDKVDSQCRVALNFIDMNRSFVDPQGNFHPKYYSISFDNLKQIERTRYFDRAFDQMAEWMGVGCDELIREAKARCKRL